MNFRKITYNETGLIDCEYDHPVLGTIPATLSPDDPETADQFADILAGNHGAIAAYVAPVRTAEELAAEDLATEQEWVVDELVQADKEIFILEDGDPRGKADIPTWRTYRKDLRNHTTGERPTRPL
jgi:hypothetical protein